VRNSRPAPSTPANKKLPVWVVALAVIAAALYGYVSNQPQKQGGTGSGTVGTFDFYVLALSWSPTYCEEKGDAADGGQCNLARPFAFVLHGLWPQNERGWPQDCDTRFGMRIDRAIADDMLDIMPSRDLVFHEWRKHGTCSGLSPDDYFSLARAAHDRVVIPARFQTVTGYQTVKPSEVERSFIAVNAGLQPNAIAVICSKRYLREVRICMDHDLAFRPCVEVDGDSCRNASTVMPPVR
jgi:ribonuclease T2